MHTYITICDNFLHAGPEVNNRASLMNWIRYIKIQAHYRFCFNLLDMSNSGSVCEHDLFQVMQILKAPEEESKAFEEILSTGEMPRELRIPFQSNVFLEGFESDFIHIIRKMQEKECIPSIQMRKKSTQQDELRSKRNSRQGDGSNPSASRMGSTRKQPTIKEPVVT